VEGEHAFWVARAMSLDGQTPPFAMALKASRCPLPSCQAHVHNEALIGL